MSLDQRLTAEFPDDLEALERLHRASPEFRGICSDLVEMLDIRARQLSASPVPTGVEFDDVSDCLAGLRSEIRLRLHDEVTVTSAYKPSEASK